MTEALSPQKNGRLLKSKHGYRDSNTFPYIRTPVALLKAVQTYKGK